MCILLNLDYAKFGVSNLLFSKVIEEKPSGGWAQRPLPLVKEGHVNLSQWLWPKNKISTVMTKLKFFVKILSELSRLLAKLHKSLML